MAKHKHYDVIVAWAEGKPVQRWHPVTKMWQDWSDDDVSPSFAPSTEYRIKPETLRYRVALFKGESYGTDVSITSAENIALVWEKRSDFVKWLNDWTEVEIPE